MVFYATGIWFRKTNIGLFKQHFFSNFPFKCECGIWGGEESYKNIHLSTFQKTQLSNYEAGKNNRATNISRDVFQMGFLNYGCISELN